MGGLAEEKARQEYKARIEGYKLDISELNQDLSDSKSENELLYRQLKEALDQLSGVAGEREELSRQFAAMQTEKERFNQAIREFAEKNEQLQQNLAEIPKTSTPSLPIKEIKKALDYHRGRSSPNIARGKIVYELASDIEEVLAGKPFTPKKNKGGRKPKR